MKRLLVFAMLIAPMAAQSNDTAIRKHHIGESVAEFAQASYGIQLDKCRLPEKDAEAAIGKKNYGQCKFLLDAATGARDTFSDFRSPFEFGTMLTQQEFVCSYIFDGGSLVRYEIRDRGTMKHSFGDLEDDLAKRFGKPSFSKSSGVQNGFGATVALPFVAWSLQDGSIVVLRRDLLYNDLRLQVNRIGWMSAEEKVRADSQHKDILQ